MQIKVFWLCIMYKIYFTLNVIINIFFIAIINLLNLLSSICVAAVHKVAYVGTLNKEEIAF